MNKASPELLSEFRNRTAPAIPASAERQRQRVLDDDHDAGDDHRQDDDRVDQALVIFLAAAHRHVDPADRQRDQDRGDDRDHQPEHALPEVGDMRGAHRFARLERVLGRLA